MLAWQGGKLPGIWLGSERDEKSVSESGETYSAVCEVDVACATLERVGLVARGFVK